MSNQLQAVKGMSDVLPGESYQWRALEQLFETCATYFGYQEIRMPLVEYTQLFKRSIGEVTDVVEKEMYTFIDKGGDSLSLRPEGTAGCVRACLEHGLLHNQQQKLFYLGPMFRHERPQKGRYRQFTQLGVEVFGIPGVGIELELLMMCQRFWQMLNIENLVTLELNTLGTLSERQAYRTLLIQYFEQHIDVLDDEAKARLHQNPMRLLDSKNPAMKPIIEHAPQLKDSLSESSIQYFQSLCDGLDALNIPYRINPHLVRGLDYYEHTVFEWTTSYLGSQATICAGGRFDKLVQHLGGAEIPAVGFAMGLERLLLLKQQTQTAFEQRPMFCYFILGCDAALYPALKIAESIRNAFPGKIVYVNTLGGSFKSQFKKADKSGARFALVLGEDEVAQAVVVLKHLRTEAEQRIVKQTDIIDVLKNIKTGS